MQSFLLIGKTDEKRQAYITDFCQKKGIGKFDTHIITPDEISSSFGIQKVKELQKIAYLKPSQGDSKALILENAQALTTDAQNALLKLLEEPPQNTFIFLSATNEAIFLPTILSRCKKIILSEDPSVQTPERVQELREQLHFLTEQGSDNKLYLAEKIAGDKEHVTVWLEDMLSLLRQNMLDDSTNDWYPKALMQLSNAYQLFQTTNVAPRVLLEHTFLSL